MAARAECHTVFLSNVPAAKDKQSNVHDVHIRDDIFHECRRYFCSSAASTKSSQIKHVSFKETVVRDLRFRIDGSYKSVVQKMNVISPIERDDAGTIVIRYDIQKLPCSAFPCTSAPDDEVYVHRTTVKLLNGRVAVQFESKRANEEGAVTYNTIRLITKDQSGAADEAGGRRDDCGDKEIDHIVKVIKSRIHLY